jgi:hypothetical protein
MKKVIFAILFAFVSTFTFAHTALTNPIPTFDSIVVKVKAGTTIYLELVNDFNTETAQVGNLIQLKVRSRVKVKGKTVVENNVLSLGRITEVSTSSANRSGSAKIEVRDVQAVDGQMINLNATYQLSPNCAAGQGCTVPAGFIITAHTMDAEEIDVD